MTYSNNSYGNSFGRQQAPARQVNITEKKKLDKKTYVDLAEKVIAELPRDNRDANKIQLSTNQIRNVLSLINELYDMVRTDTEKVLRKRSASESRSFRGKKRPLDPFLRRSDFPALYAGISGGISGVFCI